MNKSEAAKVCLLIGRLWGEKAKLDENSPEAYFMALDDIPYEMVNDAIPVALKTLVFAPAPSELRKIVMDAHVESYGIPDWAAAWNEVQKLVVSRGYYDQPRFSHKLIQRGVNAMGGWQTMCSMDVSELPNARAQFRDMYKAFRETEIRRVSGIGIQAGPDVLEVAS